MVAAKVNKDTMVSVECHRLVSLTGDGTTFGGCSFASSKQNHVAFLSLEHSNSIVHRYGDIGSQFALLWSRKGDFEVTMEWNEIKDIARRLIANPLTAMQWCCSVTLLWRKRLLKSTLRYDSSVVRRKLHLFLKSKRRNVRNNLLNRHLQTNTSSQQRRAVAACSCLVNQALDQPLHRLLKGSAFRWTPEVIVMLLVTLACSAPEVCRIWETHVIWDLAATLMIWWWWMIKVSQCFFKLFTLSMCLYK